MKDKIISISGIDGSGKTTMCENILEFYKSEGKKIVSMYDLNPEETYTTEEDFNEYYEKLKNYDVILCRFYLKSFKTKELQDKIFFEVNFNEAEVILKMIDLVKNDIRLWNKYVIEKLLNKNKTIIFDRYFYDEIAYRSLYNLNIEKVDKLYSNY